MRTRLILTLVMCLILLLSSSVQGDPNEYLSVRVLTEPEFKDDVAKVQGWFGFGRENSEVGLILGYESWQEEDGTESQMSVGVFTMYHLPDVRPVIENFLPIAWLPEEITAKPSIGGSVVGDLDGKGIETSPILELLVYETIAIQTKYNFLTDNIGLSDYWQVGISYVYRF